MHISTYFLLFITCSSFVRATSENSDVMQCYMCDSVATTGCLDPFNSTASGVWKAPCGSPTSSLQEIIHTHFPGVAHPTSNQQENVIKYYCIKAHYSDKDGKNTTFRTCSFLGPDSCELLKTAKENDQGTMTFCDICNTNLCNSAQHLSVVSIIMLVSTIFASIL